MVGNVLTTDVGQVSILDLSGLSAGLMKLLKWFLLAHLYVLEGTAKNHSARPSVFGEAPVSRIARGRSPLRTWLVLASFGQLSWLKCVDGISEVAMSTGVTALKPAFSFTGSVSVPQHHTTRATLRPASE